MNLYKRLVMSITTLAFTWAQVAFAASDVDYQQNVVERAKTAISGEMAKFKALGGQVADEAGNQLSTAQILSGQYQIFVYYPETSSVAHAKGIHFKYSTTANQSVAVSAHKENGDRIAARIFKVDADRTAEENILNIRQTMNSLEAEIEQAVALVSSKNSRVPASSAVIMPFVMLNAAMIAWNLGVCIKDPKKNVVNCGAAAFIAVITLGMIAM